MRAKRVIISFFTVLILAGLGLLLVNECAYGGGMGAAYKSCDCLGIEWELYDQTAADGPRKTLCIGIIRSRACYQYIGGPQVACDRERQLVVRTDKQVYEVGEDIAITIENHLPGPISHPDPCSLSSCQHLEGDWFCEMKECHGPTVVMEGGSARVVRTQARGTHWARLRYRFDYQIASETALRTDYSNEFTVEPRSVAGAGHSFYVRQLIPGEAWLEDGTSRYFESPTSPEGLELENNTINLDVRVGHKGTKSVTNKIRFAIALLGEDMIEVDCPEANVKAELDDHPEREVNDAIRAYEPITVPKHQWAEIFSDGSHNAPRWQLWWGELPPPGSGSDQQ